ncbi:MAG: isochorismate synthase [Crocinitomicaceae bacterium]|jgi:isochorismate synthase
MPDQGDILKYRIPNTGILHKQGVFRKSTAVELTESFVVTGFDDNQACFFEESERIEQLHFSEERPICYSKAEYLTIADKFIRRIQDQRLSKAILSRVKHFEVAVDVHAIFETLCERYPTAFVYLISSPQFGTWIGATPEVLISSRGGIGRTVALAGTMKATDQEKWGLKEQVEQQFVTDFITEQLNAQQVQDLNILGPSDFLAGPVKHLESKFRFSMRDQNSLDLALKLHPTPAISGLPREAALELIAEEERHKRKLYSGFLGVLGNSSDLFVNLRCAQVIGNDWYLYLGGGFTKDSESEKEWEETENKSRTLLDILENT